MSEQRYGYTYHRVLIDSARVLDPQFDDAVIYVTGAQLEMLRNMTQYLNRLSTYVSGYHLNYYHSPTVEDYDSILAIVADLEETLMGNPNTIWGYEERWRKKSEEVASGAGDVWVVMPQVPAGEVWVLEEAYTYHQADAAKHVIMYAQADGEYYYFADVPALAPGIYERWQGRIVLSEGDRVASWVTTPGDGKSVWFAVWGYKMVVP